jgi:transmembrane 9 superfamily protein 3
MRLSFVAAAANALILQSVQADTSDHKYTKGEHVELWVNKVGPYANPQEAYEYYKLPYCAPDTQHHPESPGGTGRWNEWKAHTMGEHLGGHALRHSGHDITFIGETPLEKCTTKELTKEEATMFKKAVQHRWFYQMYLDDLPVWGMVGEMLPMKDQITIKEKDDLDRLDHMIDLKDSEIAHLHPYVYTNRNLVISYNKDQIVKVDLTSDPKSLVEAKEGAAFEFTLAVQFVETDDDFHSRFDRYLDHDFFKHPIHWFSVFNSFMMVLFLMGLVTLILLRTLKKDYARYGLVHDLEGDEGDDDEKERGTAGYTARLETTRGYWNKWWSGEMRRYHLERQWRKQVAGVVLTLRHES